MWKCGREQCGHGGGFALFTEVPDDDRMAEGRNARVPRKINLKEWISHKNFRNAAGGGRQRSGNCGRISWTSGFHWDEIERGQGTFERKPMVNLRIREDVTKWQRIEKGNAFGTLDL